MPQVGFKPMIPIFERAKTVHALDRVATVIGSWELYFFKYFKILSYLVIWFLITISSHINLLPSTSTDSIFVMGNHL
jgi:hypothetical protein